MHGFNLPLNIDWFNAIFSAIIGSVIAGIIIALIKNEITVKKFAFYFTCLILVGTLVFFTWYNLFGSVIFISALQEEAKDGCGNAIYSYKTAVDWNPKLVDARWGFVNCAIELQRPQEALLFLEKYRDLLESEPDYLEQLSFLYLKTDNLNASLDTLTSFIDMKPKDLESWTEKIGWNALNDRRLVIAEAIMRLFRTRGSNDKPAVFWLAWSLYEQGKFLDALDHFQICITDYQNTGDNYRLGRCYAGEGFAYNQLGDKNDAKKAFIDAISTYPDQQDVKNILISIP